MSADESWENLFNYLNDLRSGETAYYRVVDERLRVLVERLVLYDDRPEQHRGAFVHYTSWENMLSILAPEEEDPLFRMYNYEFANDPEEGDIRPSMWREIENTSREIFGKYDPKLKSHQISQESTYGCSFSTGEMDVEDDLMYWRLYGGDGNGCSIKLGVPPRGIYRVRYMEKGEQGDATAEITAVACKLNRLLACMDSAIEDAPKSCQVAVCQSMNKAVDQVLDGYFHLLKNKAYKHENEWRVVQVSPDEKDVNFSVGSDRIVRRYIEGQRMEELLVTGSKITLGPRVSNKNAAIKYIKGWLRKHNMVYTEVRASSKSYRQV